MEMDDDIYHPVLFFVVVAIKICVAVSTVVLFQVACPFPTLFAPYWFSTISNMALRSLFTAMSIV